MLAVGVLDRISVLVSIIGDSVMPSIFRWYGVVSILGTRP
jgi:hypothetical protein